MLCETELEIEAGPEAVWEKDMDTVTGRDWEKAPMTAAKRVTIHKRRRAFIFGGALLFF